jgi:hypothetical protein
MRGLMTLAPLHTERRDMSSYPMIEALKYDQQCIMFTKAATYSANTDSKRLNSMGRSSSRVA